MYPKCLYSKGMVLAIYIMLDLKLEFCLNYLLLTFLSAATEEANGVLGDSPGNREIRTMGWVAEQVQMPDVRRLEWKPVFAALTDKDILLYDMVPWTCDDWASPYISHPLLATR